VPVCAGKDLAAVLGALADDAGELVVGVVEDLAQEEGRAFDGRELLEQVQELERERVGRLGVPGRLVLDERLGQPLARVHLAPHTGRAELVDREPGRHGREVGLRRLGLDVGRVVAQERLLHDVLGLRDRTEHAVGDREQVRAQLLLALHLAP
jgi:hypothetical protein